MNIINALRIGAKLDNPTPYKWFGLACSAIGLVITAVSGFAAAKGWIHAPVSSDDAILFASLVLGPLFTVSAHSAIATTDKIGVLPCADHADAKLQPKPMPSELDAAGGVTADEFNRIRNGIDETLGKFGDS